MLKIENVEVVGWEHAIRGMRNPMNSWDKSDSEFASFSAKFGKNGERIDDFELGPNDLKLMKKLAKAGTDHRKFMRFIVVYLDITAPLYWWSELDTYKIGTVRNSCSFMHKGTSRPYGIDDFSLKDEKIYHVLRYLEMKEYTLSYPYETDEYKRWIAPNGRDYRVYRNGRVIREAFDYVDNYGSGRKRHYDEAEATVYRNKTGYFVVKLSGRGGGHILLHQLVAKVWLDKPVDISATQVNHIDGNKGNNAVENLEWVTASENMQKAVEDGLYDNLDSLHRIYRVWKNNARSFPLERRSEFRQDVDKGLTHKELAEKYEITPSQANNIRYGMKHSDTEELFQECLVWERLIDCLNSMRELYLETKDDKIFQQIRSLMPQGYMQRSTFTLNYEVLANIYKSRKNHRLDEWHTFCDWIETLPYSELITGKVEKNELEEFVKGAKSIDPRIDSVNKDV